MVCFYLYEVQKSAKLVYVVRSQDNGYLRGGGWEVARKRVPGGPPTSVGIVS